jgi:hypothetical protein
MMRRQNSKMILLLTYQLTKRANACLGANRISFVTFGLIRSRPLLRSDQRSA